MQPGQGTRTGHRWLPFCQEVPDAAAALGGKHSCADFLVPRVPWGSSREEGIVSQAAPDPPGVIPPCPRGRRGACAHVSEAELT